VHPSIDFLLVEVISANVNENGTTTTAIDVNRLQSHHRRTRRSTNKDVDLVTFSEKSGRIRVMRYFSIVELAFNCSVERNTLLVKIIS